MRYAGKDGDERSRGGAPKDTLALEGETPRIQHSDEFDDDEEIFQHRHLIMQSKKELQERKILSTWNKGYVDCHQDLQKVNQTACLSHKGQ